jgi:hypothetical protein
MGKAGRGILDGINEVNGMEKGRGRFRQRHFNAFSSTRKDAKDGATKQGRASANSDDYLDDCKRQRIPRASGTMGRSSLAHGLTKQEALQIVKKGRRFVANREEFTLHRFPQLP